MNMSMKNYLSIVCPVFITNLKPLQLFFFMYSAASFLAIFIAYKKSSSEFSKILVSGLLGIIKKSQVDLVLYRILK
ncbi:hypothetical protein [Mycoplasmopsis cynos]|uniref:hypothetical protein n=1 Tax=Mycoplasmopsis cynos TaxID=171284 RepID=UPI003A5C79A8